MMTIQSNENIIDYGNLKMEDRKMNENKEKLDSERIVVFQRLMQKKEQILIATYEIEDLRRKFINQNRKDDSGEIESGIYKRIYSIIEGLSELIGYTEGRGNELFKVIVDYATFNRSEDRSKFLNPDILKVMYKDLKEFSIADSRVLDALAATANSLIITWKFKREPFVKIENLESIIQIFKVFGK
jgi:hypothetical protein